MMREFINWTSTNRCILKYIESLGRGYWPLLIVENWSREAEKLEAEVEKYLAMYLIGTYNGKMPQEVIRAMGYIKKSAAIVNQKYGLKKEISDAIVKASEEVINYNLIERFDFDKLQPNLGVQTNKMVNEVIAFHASEILHNSIKVDPDHVNMRQSSFDCFKNALQIAIVIETKRTLLPALANIKGEILKKSEEFKKIFINDLFKAPIFRPITLGQLFLESFSLLENDFKQINANLRFVTWLAQEGNAHNSMVNSYEEFDEMIIKQISLETGYRFITYPIITPVLTHETLTNFFSSFIKLTYSLHEIACNIRLLGSDQRFGTGVLLIPESDDRFCFKQGEVNSTQCEQMTAVCSQVFHDFYDIFDFNGFRNFLSDEFILLIITNVLNSIRLLSEVCNSFTRNCLVGIKPNKPVIITSITDILIQVAPLGASIGLDRSDEIAEYASINKITHKEAAVNCLGIPTEKEFEKIVAPNKVISSSKNQKIDTNNELDPVKMTSHAKLTKQEK